MKQLAKIVIRAAGVELVLSPNALRFADGGAEIELEDNFWGVEAAADECMLARIFYAEASDPGGSLLQPVRLVENIDYDFALVLPITLDAFKQEWKIRQGGYPFRNSRLDGFVSLNAPAAWAKVDGGIRLTGRMNFKNYAGTADLSLHEQLGRLHLLVSVMTAKLTDAESLHGVLSDLTDLCAEVIFQLDSPTEAGLAANEQMNDTTIMFMFHLRRLLRDGRFVAAINQIIKAPAYRNKKSRQLENMAFASEIDLIELASNPIALDWTKGGTLAKHFQGYSPIRVPVIVPKMHYDIPENQVVKTFLLTLAERLDHILRKLGGGTKARHIDLADARDYIHAVLSARLWCEVSRSQVIPYSMIMQQRSGYRDFSEAIVHFGTNAKLTDAVMTAADMGGELKPVWHLYQIWCCVQLIKCINIALGKAENLSVENIYTVGDLGADIRSVDAPLVEWRSNLDIGTPDVAFFYNKPFGNDITDSNWDGSYSRPYRPDISVCFSLGSYRHWLHFDAKYRADLKNFDNSGQIAQVKSADIDKMHTYRDALLGTRGSYVLFPSTDIETKIYVRHSESTYRKKHSLPSVGAFPLHPGKGELLDNQRRCLSDFIGNAIKSFATHGYQEELGLSSSPTTIDTKTHF